MSPEVFICYNEDDKKDTITAEFVCKVLEKNNISCWLKSRDVGHDNKIDLTMDAIDNAKLMVLVLSKQSINSPFVITEVNFAAEDKMPILAFQLEDIKSKGDLELYANDIQWLEAFPNPEENFESLVRESSQLLKKEDSKPNVSRKIKNDYRKQITNADGPVTVPWYKKYKIPIVIVVIILIAASSIFIFNSSTIQYNPPSDTLINGQVVKMNITDFHVDDVRKQDYSWNFSYFVGGTISPQPGEGDGFVIESDFYDKSGHLVNTTEVKFAEAQKVNDGFLFGSTVSGKKDIYRVEVKLLNQNGFVYAQDESQL